MEAQTTLSNSIQCGLFIYKYKGYTLSEVAFFFKWDEHVKAICKSCYVTVRIL